jgi:dipeptidyl aminopeptidase/acylaminoacyl peptidase
MRRQITFEAEQIRFGTYAPVRADVLLVQRDTGGNELHQLYSVRDGRLHLLTDGASRNLFGAWSRDGRLVGYSSTRRNGTDVDLYVMDPRDRNSNRMVLQATGGGWQIRDFSLDGSTALVGQTLSINETKLFELNLATGLRRRIDDAQTPASYRGGQYDRQGLVWVVSDLGSEFQRLGLLDPRTGRFAPISASARWDVEFFKVSPDGSFVAFVTNEAGVSRLNILNVRSRALRTAESLPQGMITGLDIAPWGEVAVTISSGRYPLDAFSVDPRTLRVTQWTRSETGGLDPSRNVEPEVVTVRSFDGLPVSGFLYRPDPERFPSKRPVIIDIHGGPEAQARPIYQFGKNYLLNELGVAIFYPNVRGSTGFGKTFVNLDNGPFRREDAVKDVGAFLESLRNDPRIDASRIGITGGSYGGYLCYASAIQFGTSLRGGVCEVAVSNLATVLETMESYRRDLRRPEYGDERDPAQRAKLIAISPLTRASEIRIPLMVVTGANDPRVPKSEADQMVAAVRANGREVWHLVGTNEGHGFSNKENDDYRFWVTLLFWQRHLLNDNAR